MVRPLTFLGSRVSFSTNTCLQTSMPMLQDLWLLIHVYTYTWNFLWVQSERLTPPPSSKLVVSLVTVMGHRIAANSERFPWWKSACPSLNGRSSLQQCRSIFFSVPLNCSTSSSVSGWYGLVLLSAIGRLFIVRYPIPPSSRKSSCSDGGCVRCAEGLYWLTDLVTSIVVCH